MHLSETKNKLFFTVYYPLLYYSISEFAELTFEEFFDSGITNHIIARDNIFKNRAIIDEYIAALIQQSKSPVDHTRLDLLRAIQNARVADFIAVRKEDSVYLIDLAKNNTIYPIVGLTQEPWEIITTFPCCTRTALIQFGDIIISDGLNHIKKLSYPKNAARLIMKDFEDDLPTMLATKL